MCSITNRGRTEKATGTTTNMSGPPFLNQNVNNMGQTLSPGQFVDPHINDQPLSFNSNKGKPPMTIEGGSDRRNNKPDEGLGNMTMGAPMQPPPIGDNMGPSSGMMMQGGPGFYGNPMGNMGFGPMIGPNPDVMNQMMMFGQMSSWGPMGPEGGGPMTDLIPQQKEIITLKSCVMYPPPPTAQPPTTRERPPGCRTIFVGGLPETATEEMIQEVFDNFGIISSVRKSKKKNFAHVRFETEDCVERSLFLSGYRMKIEDKDDKPNTGRIHVDFAMARDDQYEYECKSRAMMRDMRHRQRMEVERLRPPSPPPIIQYSDYEATQLIDTLKNGEEDFFKVSQVLLTWLERGDVNRRNINSFYSMLQCTNAHIRRLLQEKQTHEDELMQMKLKFKQIFEGILRQFDQIEKIFTTAQKQKNWDHFTKAQRKTLELWLKQAKEIKQNQQEEFLSERQEDEMEMSEDEDLASTSKKKKTEYSSDMTQHYAEMAGKLNQVHMLRDENDTLKCQVEAYKNELELMKHDSQNSTDDQDKQVKSLQLALQGMQQQLIQARSEVSDLKQNATQKERQFHKEKVELEQELKGLLEQRTSKPGTMEDEEPSSNKNTKDKDDEENSVMEKDSSIDLCSVTSDSSLTPKTSLRSISADLSISSKEAKLLGLVCCFLHVHPTGASVDYILSYLSRLDISCTSYELGNLLDRFSMVFTQTVSGIGATMERRWHYTGCRPSFLM